MLLESLVACFGVTVRAVATSLGIPMNRGTVTVEGDLDFRGTMGIKDPHGNTVPVGFKNIRLIVQVDVDEEHKSKVDKLIELSERYCVVLQTIRNGVNVETNLRSVPDTGNNNDNTTDGAQDVPANEDVLKLN